MEFYGACAHNIKWQMPIHGAVYCSRLFTKVGYFGSASIYGKCRLIKKIDKTSNDVTRLIHDTELLIKDEISKTVVRIS